MNKIELAEKVAVTSRLTKKDALKTVEDVFMIILDTLEHGEEVKISQFGTFKVKNRKERTGINPITKEQITIISKKSLSFHPSLNVKERLNK